MQLGRFKIGRFLGTLPLLGPSIVRLHILKNRWVERRRERIRKSSTLAAAANEFAKDMSLDTTHRYGVDIFHDQGNPLIGRGEVFEPEIQQCLLFLMYLDGLRGSASQFADIGANIGLHSFFLKERFPELEISAFEPSPCALHYLEFSIARNKTRGIRLYKTALGNQEGNTQYYAWGESSSGDSLRDTGRQPDRSCDLITVPITRLDSLTEVNPTVVKIDCEGAEYDILQGMHQTIRTCQPLFVVEFNRQNQAAFEVDADKVFSLLETMRYEVFDLAFRRLAKPDFISSQEQGNENFVLLPRGICANGSSVHSPDSAVI